MNMDKKIVDEITLSDEERLLYGDTKTTKIGAVGNTKTKQINKCNRHSIVDANRLRAHSMGDLSRFTQSTLQFAFGKTITGTATSNPVPVGTHASANVYQKCDLATTSGAPDASDKLIGGAASTSTPSWGNWNCTN